jgi:hypothetical protein
MGIKREYGTFLQINYFIRIMVKTHLHCHPERSEGSVTMGSEMLRCGSA